MDYKFRKTEKELNLIDYDYKDLLQSLIDDGIISATAVENKIDVMTKKQIKEAVIKSLGKEPKVYDHTDGKRVFTKIKVNGKWKNIYGYDVTELYRNIYILLHGDVNITLEKLFPRFMLYRRDMNKVTNKTLKENLNDWNKFLKNSDIVKIPLSHLKPNDFYELFEEITKDGTLTSKRVCNIKSLLNKMYAYAIRKEFAEYNPIKSVDFTEFNYYVPDNSDQVYSIENRAKLLNHLHDIIEPYSLAIQLDFQLTCRIGEIKALTWKDIDFSKRTITINKQALVEQTMNDDLSFQSRTHEVVPRVKGNKQTGKRTLHMTNEAMRILKLAKEINPNGEYVFMPDGKLMLTDTFNEYLQRYCEEVNIPYYSSHKIRFTSCSILYKKSRNLVGVSKAMGHSKISTSMHYLRDVLDSSDIDNHMEEAFSI